MSWSNEEKDQSLRSRDRNNEMSVTNDMKKSFDEFQTNGNVLQPYLIRMRSRQGVPNVQDASGKRKEPPLDATFSNLNSLQNGQTHYGDYNKVMGGTHRAGSNTPF